MQESARQRLGALAVHLGGGSVTVDTKELQKLLEHDNFETRAKLKELMKDELYVP